MDMRSFGTRGGLFVEVGYKFDANDIVARGVTQPVIPTGPEFVFPNSIINPSMYLMNLWAR